MGGRIQTEKATYEFWAYPISQDTWIQKQDLVYGNVWRGSAVSNSAFGFSLFGIDTSDQFQNTLAYFEPLSSQWTKIAIFPFEGKAHGQLIGPKGQFYLFTFRF